MDASDRAKLIANGYRIFRVHEMEKTITECTPAGGWKLHSKYPTKSALQRGWKSLHANALSIGD